MPVRLPARPQRGTPLAKEHAYGPGWYSRRGNSVATQIKGETTKVVKDVADQASQTTTELADKARETGERQLSSRKDQAAQSASELADAMRQVSDKMEQDGQQNGTAQLVATGAEQVDKIADYLRTTDINQMIGGVEDFARRQPAIFLGGAFTLGLIGARFLKAGSERRQRSGTSGYRGYRGEYAGYQGRYGGYQQGAFGSGYGAGFGSTAGYEGASGSETTPETEADAWAEPAGAAPAYDPYHEAGESDRRV